MTVDDQAVEVRELLLGAVVRSVGRAADMCVVEFSDRRGEVVSLHAQCPFRILQGGKLIIGSRDMGFPQRGAGPQAFDRFETVYDSRAATLNGILGQVSPTVAEVTLGDAGSLAVEWEPGFRMEVFPDCSGSLEAWRVLVRGGRHLGFPADLI